MSALHSHLAICIEALTIKILLSAGQLVHGCVMGFVFFYAGLQRRSKDESEYQIQGLIWCTCVGSYYCWQTNKAYQ